MVDIRHFKVWKSKNLVLRTKFQWNRKKWECYRWCFTLPQLLFVLLLSLHTNLGIVLNFVLIEERKSSWRKSKTLNAFFSKLGFLTFKLWNAVSQPFFELGSWMKSRWKENFLLHTTIREIAYLGNWLFGKFIIQEIEYSGN